MLDKADLKKLQNADIESCDKDSLTDLNNFKLDSSNSNQQTVDKIKTFVKQMSNPYLFRVGETVVKVEYDGRKSLNEAFANIIRAG